MSDTCLFCRIVRREIPAAVVAETETALAFRDVNPQAPLHALVIPKRHVASLAAAARRATATRAFAPS
jgi:histidine triad (HIT) family protein